MTQLPSSGEIVIFNRSWYNRAGVERVMGFCTDEEYEQFIQTVPMFEQLIVHCALTIVKYYLDITRDERSATSFRRSCWSRKTEQISSASSRIMGSSGKTSRPAAASLPRDKDLRCWFRMPTLSPRDQGSHSQTGLKSAVISPRACRSSTASLVTRCPQRPATQRRATLEARLADDEL